MIINRIFIFYLVLLSSCIYTESRYEEKVLFATLNDTTSDSLEINLNIVAGDISIIANHLPNEQKVYKLYFHKVNGGSTIFLGKKIKETDGYKVKRLKIIKQNKEIAKYSINDLLKMPKMEIDSLIVIDVKF